MSETTEVQAAPTSINTDIVIGGQKYVLTDFANAWTIRQNRVATAIVSQAYKDAVSTLDETSSALSAGAGAIAHMAASEADFDLLAAIYLNEGETIFDPATYEDRRKAFAEGDIKQAVADEALQLFFDSGVLSMKSVSRIFSVMTKMQ